MKRTKLPEKGFDLGAKPKIKLTLSDRFLCPPFSVLRTDSPAWQKRKRRWLSDLPPENRFIFYVRILV